ncbi:hypothetical protein Ancab_029979 [Ancistrocladus abbreviatus]
MTTRCSTIAIRSYGFTPSNCQFFFYPTKNRNLKCKSNRYVIAASTKLRQALKERRPQNVDGEFYVGNCVILVLQFLKFCSCLLSVSETSLKAGSCDCKLRQDTRNHSVRLDSWKEFTGFRRNRKGSKLLVAIKNP